MPTVALTFLTWKEVIALRKLLLVPFAIKIRFRIVGGIDGDRAHLPVVVIDIIEVSCYTTSLLFNDVVLL